MQVPRAIAVTYNALGRDLLSSGDPKAALENHQAALALSQELLASDPTSESRKSDLAFTEARLGKHKLLSEITTPLCKVIARRWPSADPRN